MDQHSHVGAGAQIVTHGLPYPNAKRTSSIILAVLPNRFNEMLSAGSPRASEFFTFGVEIE
jgi:hypothetical protein